MIEAIGPLSALSELAPTPLAPNVAGPSDREFANIVGSGLQTLNSSLTQADDATRALAADADVPLHDVMISLEKARLDLQFAVQVRNRVVSAYQDIIRMQV